MTNCMLGGTNYFKTGSLTAGAADVNLPVSNLSTDQGYAAAGWQTPAGVTLAPTGATFELAVATASPFQVVVLARTNLSPTAVCLFAIMDASRNVLARQTVAGPAPGFGQVVCIFPTIITGSILAVQIIDAGNPDGAINIPLAWAGAPWQPTRNISYTSALGRDRTDNVTTTRGGQEYALTQFVRRRWSVVHTSLAEAEALGPLMTVLQSSDTQTNILFIPDPGSAFLSQQAVLGRLTVKADLAYSAQGADRRSISFDITERL